MTDQADHTIYIRKRPSTQDEDRWASGWVRREWIKSRGSQTVFAIIVWTLAWLIITAGAFVLYGHGGWIAVGGTLLGVVALIARHAWLGRHRPRVGDQPIATVLALSVPVLKAWQIDNHTTEHIIQFGPGLFLANWKRTSRAPTPSRLGTSPGWRTELEYYIVDCPWYAMVRGNRCLMTVRFIGQYEGQLGSTNGTDIPRIVFDADDWCFSHTFDEVGRQGLPIPARGEPVVVRELRSPLLRDSVTVVEETVQS